MPNLIYNYSRDKMFNFENLPVYSGTYILQFAIQRARSIEIGRLGQHRLPVGNYFYVGSACGVGGLRARVGRHLRGAGRWHWHIDYVRAVAEVQNVFYTVTDERLECAWSQVLAGLPLSFIPIPRFGASDCRAGCAAHLVAFPRYPNIPHLLSALAATGKTPLVQVGHR